MVRLTAKIGLVVEFEMGDEVKEKSLVDKFILGSVKQKALLKLGKYGSIQVSDIADMQFIPAPKEHKTVGSINLEDAIFGGNGFGSIFNK